MARGKSISAIRGKRLRVTRVNGAGSPVIGDGNMAASKGFVTVSYTTNTEEGEAVTSTNANGEICANEPGTPSFNGFGVEIEFCDVDFAIFELITGQELVLDEDGEIIGITESTSVSLADVSFALEVWTGGKISGNLPAGADGQFGYILTPFLSGGLIGDISIENAAITFTATGMATKNGAGWGSGPYAVELVGGEKQALRTPLKSNDHRRIQVTYVAPPSSLVGAQPVLDPSDPALTSIAGTVTGLSVAFAATPSGQPVIYEFGDGTWDYAEAGSFTKVYDAPGNYTVTAHSGLSTVTTQVTAVQA